MAYLLLKTDQPAILPWTEEEKASKLEHLFKKNGLLLPEDFYTPALSAEDLEHMLKKLNSHTGIRSPQLAVRFSDNIPEAARCEIEDKQACLVIHARFAGNPFMCGALLAHTFCHYVLLAKHTVCFKDPNENEKVADLATIYAGLGVIVLNGAMPSGWRYLFKHWTVRRKIVTGYFHARSYGNMLKRYLNERQIPVETVTPSTLPWVRSLLGEEFKDSDNSLPAFMQRAVFFHKRSKRYFWMSAFTIVLFIGSVTYTLSQRPVFLSDELRVQKQKIDGLANSYQGCAKRVQHVKDHYDENEPSTKRYIDNELIECKSLQNRYNYEIEAYNTMLKNYTK